MLLPFPKATFGSHKILGKGKERKKNTVKKIHTRERKGKEIKYCTKKKLTRERKGNKIL